MSNSNFNYEGCEWTKGYEILMDEKEGCEVERTDKPEK
jgi:hypothetical protein